MCKDFIVNWDEVDKIKVDGEYVNRKIYTEHLPKKSRGYINWKESVGMVVPILYNNIEYNIIIENSVKNGKHPYLIINIEGYYKVDFKIDNSHFLKGKIQGLINNVYANPNHEYRQLIINSVGEEEAKKLTIGSRKEIKIICKECGGEHTQRLNSLYGQGFSCPYCGDGVSYPEKVVALILKMLGIRFTRQHKFDEYSYKYDFYLIDYDAIIEVHGIQHYYYLDIETMYNRIKNGKNGIEEHENDMIKYDVAVLKNYEYNKNYVIINASESNIDYIRNSIEQCEFFKQFDLSNIDWQEIDKQAQTSQKIDVCKYWKEQKEIDKDLTTTDLVKEFGISRNTIYRYLTWGNERQLCEYDGSEERQAQIKRFTTLVYLVKPNGEKWFSEPMSESELTRQSGISLRTICRFFNSGEPLRKDSRAKYDPKYIGSYIMTVEDYNLKYGSN